MKKKVLSEEALKVVLKSEAAPEPKAEDVLKKDDAQVVEPKANEEVIEDLSAEDKLIALQEEFDKFKADVSAAAEETDKAHTEAMSTLESSVKGLKEIVSGQVSRMRVGLGMSAIDMAEFSSESLLTEFEAISEKFMALPVGPVVPVAQEESKVEQVVASSADESAISALGF